VGVSEFSRHSSSPQAQVRPSRMTEAIKAVLIPFSWCFR